MHDHLNETAAGDDGQPRVVYHGTSRDFTDFSADAQEEALFGRAFYFTDDRDVARGYAEIRHLPPVDAFDDRAALDAFLADHPGWEAAYVDEVGGRLVVQFRNPEHRPQVIHVQLLIERPLDLDESPPAELLALVRERLNGEPAETPATAGGLYTAMTAAFVKAGADEAEAAQQARQVISDAGFDGLTHVDRRYENHHRVWMAFRAEQVVEIERELL